MKNLMRRVLFLGLGILTFSQASFAQGTRLLRQPNMSDNKITFVYAGDLWVADKDGSNVLRLTSTPAVESNPYFSPDGKLIAFSSNRSGIPTVYTIPAEGGELKRLTWYASGANVLGWSPDGENILYASVRETAPKSYDRLWTVSKNGGPSRLLSQQWGTKASYSPDGKRLIVDKVRRWDTEWRAYRGGQNTPLFILDLETQEETLLLPHKATTDIQPVWLKDKIYFLSDRDWVTNIWTYEPASKQMKQETQFEGNDIKWLSGHSNELIYERNGYLHIYDLASKSSKQLEIHVKGDFPWAETVWEDLSKRAGSLSLSPTGKRAIMTARGEVFTVPVEHGDARNITNNSAVADRNPIWSPKGDKIAWFADANGKNYTLMIADQDGMSKPEALSVGESKMAWEPTWSPDGKHIAFCDDDVRVRLINLETKEIKTIDVAGNNMERGNLGLTWSTDSKYLAYARTGENHYARVYIYSLTENKTRPITNELADAISPAWDRDGKHLYFLASTDLALGSGYVNTSSMTAKSPVYEAYVVNLRKKDPSPFELRSDEEEVKKEEPAEKKKDKKKGKDKGKSDKKAEDKGITIDFDGIESRIMALPTDTNNGYRFTLAGPKGVVFLGEYNRKKRSYSLHKFKLKDRKAKEFSSGLRAASVSADGKKLLARVGPSWKVMDTSAPNGKGGKSLKIKIQTKLDRKAEWQQMFDEAWCYQRDYFYDPNMHGRDWSEVYERYSPLVPYVKHRSDLNYLLDMVNGELSVGHSFVFGGDMPKTERQSVGLLGADFSPEGKYWKIERIFTTESWNPGLSSPLQRPGLKVAEGNYLVGVNGEEISNTEDLYKYMDGTLRKQTVLHINSSPKFEGAWKITVKPIRSEAGLRQRAWVEDNRRLVDELSGGRLAYVWVPNTSGQGFVSFNRYFFAQQHKEGAVIDERFNGGGLLDDYMVDLMNRELRAALTNEVPNGKPIRLPNGILGPKVLLVNELAGSGGDFFPWVFKHQKIGPVIGMTTWGGLVKSSVHYRLVDGGALTAPDNAVFDPNANEWVSENKGTTPTIEVRQDAKSLQKGKDPQLLRAIEEAMKLLPKEKKEITPPPFSTPALKK